MTKPIGFGLELSFLLSAAITARTTGPPAAFKPEAKPAAMRAFLLILIASLANLSNALLKTSLLLLAIVVIISDPVDPANSEKSR